MLRRQTVELAENFFLEVEALRYCLYNHPGFGDCRFKGFCKNNTSSNCSGPGLYQLGQRRVDVSFCAVQLSEFGIVEPHFSTAASEHQCNSRTESSRSDDGCGTSCWVEPGLNALLMNHVATPRASDASDPPMSRFCQDNCPEFYAQLGKMPVMRCEAL